MSEVSHTTHEHGEARMATMGGSIDSRTAAAVRGGVSNDPTSRYHRWPLDRPTAEVIAERMLMAALLNYRRAKAGIDLSDFKTHDQMSDIECGFYERAVHTAYAAIWEGR